MTETPLQPLRAETAPRCQRAWAAPQLWSAYTLWAEHHQGCAHCRQHDWYMPGDVRETDDPLLADGQVEVRVRENGKKPTTRLVYFRRAPDVRVLCREGRLLFQQWTHQALTQEAKGMGRLG